MIKPFKTVFLMSKLLLMIRKERQDYYKKKGEAIMKPGEALSLIIDGMDQSKTNIPHFKGWTRPKVRKPVIFLYDRKILCVYYGMMLLSSSLSASSLGIVVRHLSTG